MRKPRTNDLPWLPMLVVSAGVAALAVGLALKTPATMKSTPSMAVLPNPVDQPLLNQNGQAVAPIPEVMPVEIEREIVPLPEPEPVAVMETAPNPRPLQVAITSTKLDTRESGELEAMLRNVRVVYLEDAKSQTVAKKLLAEARTQAKKKQIYTGAMGLSKTRPDLAGLPFQCGPDTKLSKSAAETMDSLSKRYREIAGKNPDANRLYATLAGAFIPENSMEKPWSGPDAVACIRQMMQPEAAERRGTATALLSQIKTSASTAALVQWAVFDTDEQNRTEAVHALRTRDPDEVAKLLAPHLRYPWLPAVEHTCEAIATLNLTQSIPDLFEARNRPDPDLPYQVDLPFGMGGTFRRELVRVNHARNCVMCHTPSLDEKESLRAAVPDPDSPLPPPNSQAYYGSPGEQIAASTTYLRQDFSLVQSTGSAGPWPDRQRFDFFVAVKREFHEATPSLRGARGYHAAYSYALRALGAPIPELAEPLKDANLAETARFAILQLSPETWATWKNGKDLLQMKPGELAAHVTTQQYSDGARITRLALLAYFAEQAEKSGAQQQKAARMLAAVREKTPEGLLPDRLMKAAMQ